MRETRRENRNENRNERTTYDAEEREEGRWERERERGDLRIRRKKEQGREAGRYDTTNNAPTGSASFPPSSLPLPPPPSLFLAALSVSLHSPSYSCLLFNGARRCSLIDGTGHGRTAARKKETEGRKKRNRNGRGKEARRGRMSGRRKRRAVSGPPSPYL